MRPKNAGINLEPIPERERKKREKNTRVLCYTGKDWCVCFASHRRLLRASPRKIERRRRWWRTRFRRFRRFLLLDPVSRFSEGRSFSAFSLDVINYPRLICACATRRKKKKRDEKDREKTTTNQKSVLSREASLRVWVERRLSCTSSSSPETFDKQKKRD